MLSLPLPLPLSLPDSRPRVSRVLIGSVAVARVVVVVVVVVVVNTRNCTRTIHLIYVGGESRQWSQGCRVSRPSCSAALLVAILEFATNF